MINLQLIDSLDGGYFGFDRNDYPIDEGIYTELYCALFSTETPQWCLDVAFNVESYSISSSTGTALKNNSTINSTNLNIIKKAVLNDLSRFTNKNKSIVIKGVELATWSKTLLIIIELTGYDEAFNFIYNKTGESLLNANFKKY